MRTKFIFAILFLLSLSFTSCNQDDIDDLYSKHSELEKRINDLEAWSKTVNKDIASLQAVMTALEQRDHVTGVTPLMEGGKQIGYTVIFAKSTAINILNGKDGLNGTNGTNGTNGVDGKDGVSPIISVKQDESGNYYWVQKTSDGKITEVLDDNGNKITTTPQVRINTETNMWEISTNNGANWTSSNVSAVGPKGEQGDKGEDGQNGDSIFAGIDISNDDHIILGLANGIQISIPRYKALSFNFMEPIAPFNNSEERTIKFVLNGEATSVNIISVPTSWTITVDNTTNELKIKAPNYFYQSELYSEFVLFATDGKTVITQSFSLTPAVGTYVSANWYGAYVAEAKTNESEGLLVANSRDWEVWTSYSLPVYTGATSSTDGKSNTEIILNYINSQNVSSYDFRPIYYCTNNGSGWYLPAKDELKDLFTQKINLSLTNKLNIYANDVFWSSTEIESQKNKVYAFDVQSASIVIKDKYTNSYYDGAKTLAFKRY